MLTALQSERNQIDPRLLRLENLATYIRGGTLYKPFPGPQWYTPSRVAVIHAKIRQARSFTVAKVGTVDTDSAMEIERYYLSLLARYQFLAFGGEIGPDMERLSKSYKTVVRARSIRDWHKLLDFLSDRMFYWGKQRRMNIAQVEAMLRVWLLIKFHHKNRDESSSLHYANNMRPTRTVRQRRKSGARSRSRRGI